VGNERKATENQKTALILSGRISEEKAKQINFKEAHQILSVEMPKFYAKKLVEWGYFTKKQIDAMSLGELKREFRSGRDVHEADKRNKMIDKFEVEEIIWYEPKQVKAKVVVKRHEKPGTNRNNFTIQFENGRKQAIGYSSSIEKYTGQDKKTKSENVA